MNQDNNQNQDLNRDSSAANAAGEQGSGSQNAGVEGGYNQNAYGQNAYNQNGYNQNAYGQGGCNQSGYNQNAYGQNAYNQNSYNQNAYGQNAYNQNGYQNAYGQNAYNQNGYGQQGNTQYYYYQQNVYTDESGLFSENKLMRLNGPSASIKIGDWMKSDCISLLNFTCIGSIVAIILYFVLAFSSKTAKSIRTRYQANLIWSAIALGLWLVLFVILAIAGLSIFTAAGSAFR